jgi:cystathionine beta-lyase/cystathionine gamma-synthase
MADEKKPQGRVSPRTHAVHGAFSSKAWEFSRHLMPPMTASTTFRLDSLKRGAQGFIEFGEGKGSNEPTILIYDRLDEPNTMLLEEQLAGLECRKWNGRHHGILAFDDTVRSENFGPCHTLRLYGKFTESVVASNGY